MVTDAIASGSALPSSAPLQPRLLRSQLSGITEKNGGERRGDLNLHGGARNRDAARNWAIRLSNNFKDLDDNNGPLRRHVAPADGDHARGGASVHRAQVYHQDLIL